MFVQVYRGDSPTVIYEGNTKIATLPTSGSVETTDLFLKTLGLQRHGRWDATEWGWQATVAKRQKNTRR
jgi:hypothetical protein